MIPQNSDEQSITELLMIVLKNQEAIAQKLGVTLASPQTDAPVMNNNVRAYNSNIMQLRMQMVCVDAFDKAIELGLLTVNADGTLDSHFGSNTLLACFLGRCLGDTTRKGLWIPGTYIWPDKLLTQLFGVNSLRTLRKNRLMQNVPKNFYELDNLF